MSMRPLAIGSLALLLVAGFSPGRAVAQEKTEQAAEAQAEVSCSDCHDQAKAFVANPHAKGSVKDGVVSNDVCTTCHGDGAEHIAGGGDKTKISIPKGRKGADETCRMCHDTTTDRKSHAGSVHANSAAVNCMSCHSIHKSEPRAEHLLARSEPALCGTCHSTQVASLRNKPYAHRVNEGVMGCTTCHEAHGRAGRDNLKTTASGELPCMNCHTDKRGPFVFQHGAASVGDCTSCHEPHGSSNARQLKRASVQQLCLECHSFIAGAAATVGGQPPAFHNISNARYQNCTTCHVAVHGSNRSPQLLK